MTINVYLFSLGGLVKSDMNKSIKAFSNLVAKESSLPYFSTVWVYYSLFMDTSYYKTIDNYKLGKINSDEFKSKISSQLGIKESNEFESAWNAMCELTPEAAEKIVRILTQQQERFKLGIMSATNPLQYDYIISSVNKKLKDANLPNIDDNHGVTVVTSFEEHNLQLLELAKMAIQENGWDDHEYNIISLDSRITKDSLMLEYASFAYDKEQKLFFTGEIEQDF